MAPHIALLLGKPPKPGTLLAEVTEDLAAHGMPATLHLPHDQALDPAQLDGADLVVHRGLHTSVAPLLAAIHDRDTPMCNPWPADQLLRDRRPWHAELERAGVPVPPSVTVEAWAEVRQTAGTEHVVAKALAGPGRGATVVAGNSATLPADPPFLGPFLVEPRLATDGTDRKLYVAGDQVRGLLKPSTLEHPHTTSGTPFRPDAALTELALETARVVGGHLLGVDVIATPNGPVVVDVNGFPGFRGVEDAPALVAAHIREHAGAG
ncbi:MAG: hypothetical protein DI611_14045 [Brachybacterium faecium]|nr:MAG: hypothetical protein DI611_14045 [Brachybacterium faecium]